MVHRCPTMNNMVRDGFNRPDDESTPELSQEEQDEKRRREALNEEWECDHDPPCDRADGDSDWRPIETAPKDGTKVIIECQGASVEAVYLPRKDIWVSPDGGCGYDPLLWKPLE